MLLSLIILCRTLAFAQAKVTVYGQVALGFTTTGTGGTGGTSTPTATPAAYNNTRLTPPAIPNPAPSNSFSLFLQQDASAVDGLSIPHVGVCFWGFSIEMSVISQVRKFLLFVLSFLFFFFLIICFYIFSWQKLVC